MIAALATALLAGSVIVGPQPSVPAATYPVEDLGFPDPALVFTDASLDGAVTDTGGRDFTLRSDVLFAFDKSALNARAKREIAGVASKLKSQGEGQRPVTKVTVTGYTDDVGSDAYNLKLSKRRAQAVQKALSAALGGGVRVTAKGLGEADPIASNDKASGRKVNRRVEIRST